MDSSDGDEYPSCEWIEGGIAFNRSSLHTCLIAHHNTGLPFISGYRGGALPLETVVEVRKEIRNANRHGGHPQCAGCAHLKKRSWPEGAYPIRIVGIAHYSHCNIECSYCFLQTQDPASFADGFRPYPLLATFKSLIENRALSPHAIVDWGGGEPTAYREFDELLDLLLSHGTSHYLHTNGTRLPDAIRRTSSPERIHVICSVDAGLPETYVAIKKRDYLDRVWLNLEEYGRLGVKVTCKYIVMAENSADVELDAFMARAVRAGVKDLIVDIDYNFPNSGPEIATAVGRLLHRALRAGMNARFGFTGDNFASERGIAGRTAAAYQQEELAGVAKLLKDRGYEWGATMDSRVQALVSSLETHCASLLSQCGDKEREIRQLDSALTELRRWGATMDSRVQALASSLETHCASLLSQCMDKEREIRQLDSALTELRRPRTLVRALALAALAKAGFHMRQR